MVPLPSFDEIHVISDLHMGGEGSERQIFREGPTLARLVDHLRDREPKRRLALVINGDVVDFLAEPHPTYLDWRGAIGKLERIFADPAFAPAIDALRRFVRKIRRRLIIVLGNHDLELALPWVRARLLDLLCEGDDRARGRIDLCFDGAGFACRVGDARVLCVHGNDADPWNLTDHEQLRRVAAAVHLGRAPEPWVPNAGTKLVIDVMNEVKRSHPFVDLLKPEGRAVLPAVYAMAPQARRQIGAVLAVGRRLGTDTLRRAGGFLSAESDGAVSGPRDAEIDPTGLLDEVLGEALTTPASVADPHQVLQETEDALKAGRDPFDLIAADETRQYLSLTSALVDWFRGRDRWEVLREALESLRRDQSFDRKSIDTIYRRLDPEVRGVDFLVAGHSHLERALLRTGNQGFYYNTGTWARLMRLTSDRLAESNFKATYDVLDRGTMAALDQEPGLVLRRPAVLSIVEDGGTVRGALHRVEVEPAKQPLLLPIEGSELTRG